MSLTGKQNFSLVCELTAKAASKAAHQSLSCGTTGEAEILRYICLWVGHQDWQMISALGSVRQ